MVCVCCDPFKNCCPGGRTPDQVLFTITGVTYKSDAPELSFPIVGSYVLDRYLGLCSSWLSSFFPTSGICARCPGFVVSPEPTHKLTIWLQLGTPSQNAGIRPVQVVVNDNAYPFPPISGLNCGVVSAASSTDSGLPDPSACNLLTGQVSGFTFMQDPTCDVIERIDYTIEAA